MVTIPDRILTCECTTTMAVERTCIKRDDAGLAWFASLACPTCGATRTYRDPLTARGMA